MSNAFLNFLKAEYNLAVHHLENPTPADKAIETAVLAIIEIYATQGTAGFTIPFLIKTLTDLAVVVPEAAAALTTVEFGNAVKNAVTANTAK